MFSIGDSKLATEENTYTKQISVKDTEIYTSRSFNNPGITRLNFYTQGEKYIVINKRDEYESHEDIILDMKTEDELTITVLKRTRILGNFIAEKKEVVDVRSDSTVYYDIDDYNEVDPVGKTILIVVVIIIWIVVTGISVFRIYFGIFQDSWLFD